MNIKVTFSGIILFSLFSFNLFAASYLTDTLNSKVVLPTILRPSDNGSGKIEFTDNGFGYPYATKFVTFTSPIEWYGLTNDYGTGTSEHLSIVSQHNSGAGNIGFYVGITNNKTAAMTINSNGYVGINKTPSALLDIAGLAKADSIISNNGVTNKIVKFSSTKSFVPSIFTDDGTHAGIQEYSSNKNKFVIKNDLNAYTLDSITALSTSLPTNWNCVADLRLRNANGNTAMVLWTDGVVNKYNGMIQIGNYGNTYANYLGKLFLNPMGGYVGINKKTATAPLDIKGLAKADSLHTKTAVIDTLSTTMVTAAAFKVGNWVMREKAAPDYVFKKEYQLQSLDTVEKFVKTNSHLPEVPSAEQMKKDGVDLVEMNMTLLKKVEELTLYMIEQKKTNSEQQTLIEKQQSRIDQLEKLVKK